MALRAKRSIWKTSKDLGIKTSEMESCTGECRKIVDGSDEELFFG